MDLVKINDLTRQLGLSSRTLRYYEEIGLIESVRPAFETYRSYDAENIERLRQIMILRKMQIPVKDIIDIYRSKDMSVVVDTFVKRIRAIDEEVAALSELKRVVNEFLQAMQKSGISKISALPFLYEKMEKQLETLERDKPTTYTELSALSEKLEKPPEPSIINLPPMRVLSSCRKDNTSDTEGFWRYIHEQGIAAGEPGRHDQFEFQTESGDAVMLYIPDDFANDSEFTYYTFEGGLFATANVYLDEDLGGRFHSLIASFDGNKYYQIDYANSGTLRHEAMIENLISPDGRRQLVAMYVPVKERLADPALFDKPQELEPDSISPEEIIRQNPALWEADVPLDKLTPINSPNYRMTENGEAMYIGTISTRVLSTNVEVKLPFRVDIEFRIDESNARYGYGSSEGDLSFYHGEDLNYYFAINQGNRASESRLQESLRFHQPVFKDHYDFPGRGGIKPNICNRLTWIVGEKHFAVIINNELRYCGINFPYMALDLARQETRPIVIGSNGTAIKYFKSIRVSQLAHTPKTKIKEGELTIAPKRSNNIIPAIHRFITSEYGENYWFNGCGRYAMYALGEKDYGYEFFAGLTGDVFTQVFSYDFFRGDCLTDYMMNTPNGVRFIENIFNQCGYESTFVPEAQIKSHRELYLEKLLAHIDRGIPVISNMIIEGRGTWLVFVGYEEYGKTLLFMTDNIAEPEHVSTEAVFRKNIGTDIKTKNRIKSMASPSNDPLFAPNDKNNTWLRGMAFIGEKKETPDLATIYRNSIRNLPKLLTTKTDDYCFGAQAFRAWADEIESGKYDGMKPENFDGWCMYTNYVCILATNASCCYQFLEKAMELNPDLAFLHEVHKQYEKMGRMWNNDSGSDLEALGGGFNVSLTALQDREKRSKIAAKLREFAQCVDEAVRILKKNKFY
jgi:DNA-binding transcriptional MerR regulator